ncbi:MAG: winged helix-turn-helix domain-containing protein [Candidatus ainarchaeum sp.]|nr:winged helix-turn-helix domain-containing protein [Candidatus ainarchaeum sp.]
MEKKFILDSKSFKALSAKSRVNILKNLLNRRMTLSELSQKLTLKNSTTKEHCELLMNAELIKKIEDGRKWKYYELTNKGKQIIQPNPLNEIKILVMLSSSAIIITLILLIIMQTTILNNNDFLTKDYFNDTTPQIMTMTINYNETIENTKLINEYNTNSNSNEIISLQGISYNFYSIGIMITLIIGIFAGWFVGKKYSNA